MSLLTEERPTITAEEVSAANTDAVLKTFLRAKRKSLMQQREALRMQIAALETEISLFGSPSKPKKGQP